MKKSCLVVLVAALTAGCSPLLYPGAYSYPAIGRVRPQAMTPALPTGRWDLVMRLPRLALIDVLTRDGVPTVGAFIGADASSVRLDVGGTEVRVPREEIIRVDLVDLPGSETAAAVRGAARGTLLGLGAAALLSAVVGGEAWPPPGALLRAGGAIGGVSGASSAMGTRRGRVIYLAPGW